jgi:hypothetical protein
MTALDDLPPWHRSCRADLPIAPDTIAGILDGDGTLALVCRGSPRRWVPIIGLSMRDDDPTPIAVFRSLAAYLGGPVGHVHAGPRKLHWRATALADVTAVLRFLERHPLLSPRGATQLAILAEAASILRSARPRRGASIPLVAEEHARLDALRAAIPARARVDAGLPVPAIAGEIAMRRLHDYLAGFAAAEGSFQAPGGGRGRARPTFTITQRIDNQALLETLRDRLAMGRIGGIPVKVGSPALAWVVDRDEDVDRLVTLFRAHPLPEASPKAWQFDAWAELIAVRHGIVGSGRRGDLGRSSAVAALVAELRAAKAYVGPASLCACPPARGDNRTA